MKTLINLLLAFSLVFAFSCKTREKQVQKSENQTETKSESNAKINANTFEFSLSKEIQEQTKSLRLQSNSLLREEAKNVQIEKHYYENGNIKSEIQKDLSNISESNVQSFQELQETLKSEIQKAYESKSQLAYLEKSYIEQKAKANKYEMKLKAKETFTWQMFFVGLILGVFLLPLLRWIFSWVKRFQPWLKFVEFLNKKIK
jgi:Zn-dependent M32 family carboxypeptidase